MADMYNTNMSSISIQKFNLSLRSRRALKQQHVTLFTLTFAIFSFLTVIPLLLVLGFRNVKSACRKIMGWEYSPLAQRHKEINIYTALYLPFIVLLPPSCAVVQFSSVNF